jgi:hypothetical protein
MESGFLLQTTLYGKPFIGEVMMNAVEKNPATATPFETR